MPGDALKARRRSELREFLMSRRARVTPADAGLPEGGARRRTPGLRREEVAVLAGVGASWYQWLEQGRNISVSPQVLDSVARVLRLSNAERRHLYVLAGMNPPVPEIAPDRQRDICEGLQRLIDTWMPYPAQIMDPYYNTVLFNDAAATVFGLRPGITQNCLVDFFTDPMYRSRTRSWEQNARTVVAQFRATCMASLDDEGFQAMAAELKAASAEFTELWERRDIEEAGQIRKEMDHPVLGMLYFESSVMRLPARPDLSIVLHTPLNEADTADKLEWLASPEGRRGAMYPTAG
ncbi:helix-turn-helix transcriptional regulator [Streptomyces sp. NBC_01373]|uniref:helix-turn-helix transcriptional regulator n=1 Tax=Streptomyces sp. NBC_01373 TaxID=2903843 RepID=UPI0022561609|nr:helix-turn-helix transcriptional regulator [Streptomyces sp. NBC_01373]MCX4703206.1 helix-turn-helix transcriptional regulator [Streptomyces sp. NBC_01373]